MSDDTFDLLSGLNEDDYGEESGADLDSPLDEPGADQLTEDDHWGDHAHLEDDDESDRLSRDIRRLQDADSYRLGVQLWKGDKSFFGFVHQQDPPKRPRIETSFSAGTAGMDAEAWANLPEDSLLLDRPLEWEQAARLDQTQAEPLGMDPDWAAVSAVVEKTWAAERPQYPVIPGNGSAYHEHELSDPEINAMFDITLDLLEGNFNPDELKQRAQRAVRLAQGRIFEEETRGGARERGVPGKAKRRFPHGHLSGPYHHFDFTTRWKGKGAAKRDTRAMEEWLVSQLHEAHRRRWVIGPDGPFSLGDYRKALRPGNKSAEMKAVYRELAVRVKELTEDGAFKTAIAEVLKCKPHTVTELVKAAEERFSA